jgi:hypothetical protein
VRRCSAAFQWRERLPLAAIVYVSSEGGIFDFANMGLLDIRLAATTGFRCQRFESPSPPYGVLGSAAFYFFFILLRFVVPSFGHFHSHGSSF